MKFIIILLAIITAIYLYVQLLVSRLDFNFGLSKIDLSKFQLGRVITGGSSNAKVVVDASITNANSVNLSFSNLYIEIYYNETLIAYSTDNISNYAKVVIEAGSVTIIQEELNIVVNGNTVDFGLKMNLNEQLLISYKIRLKLLGLITFGYTGTKTLNS